MTNQRINKQHAASVGAAKGAEEAERAAGEGAEEGADGASAAGIVEDAEGAEGEAKGGEGRRGEKEGGDGATKVEHTQPLEYLWAHLRSIGENPAAVWADVRNAVTRLMAAVHPTLLQPVGDLNGAAHELLFLPKVRHPVALASLQQPSGGITRLGPSTDGERLISDGSKNRAKLDSQRICVRRAGTCDVRVTSAQSPRRVQAGGSCAPRGTSDCWNVDHVGLVRAGWRQILGVDVMLDDALRVWVLEVNRFPALEARGTRDKAIKAAVVDAAWWLAFGAGGMPGLGGGAGEGGGEAGQVTSVLEDLSELIES